jgi:DNA-binding NtrC family response regulator
MTGTGGHLLVADDKRNMLQLLERILSQHYRVDVAEDGATALQAIAQHEYDVVLTDLRMPGADGFAVVRAAKERAPATEVVIMTGFASVDSAVEAMRLGAYDYLQKPFDPDDVVLVVARALERRRQRANPTAGWPPTPMAAPAATVTEPRDPPSLSYRDAVNHARDNVSKEYLSALLRAFDGNVTRAAHHARLERESLHRLLKRYRLRAESFRSVSEEEAGQGPPPADEEDGEKGGGTPP